jgi:predicted nucleic acid-binding Zn ribbon protein
VNETQKCFGCGRQVPSTQWFCGKACGEKERQRHEEFEAKRQGVRRA